MWVAAGKSLDGYERILRMRYDEFVELVLMQNGIDKALEEYNKHA